MATSQSAAGLTVLVTGGGGGLGKAIAEAYLAAGAKVAICDLNAARLAATKEEWTKTGGHDESRILTQAVDVTDDAAVQALVDATVARFGGRLDVLVNNAGVMDGWTGAGAALDVDKDWRRVIDVNLTGSFLATRAAVLQMQKQDAGVAEAAKVEEGDGIEETARKLGLKRGGSIINIASVAGQRGFLAGAAYTASKHGLLGLTKNTAAMYGIDNICSTALVLGAMPGTNIADSLKTGQLSPDMAGYQRTQTANPGMVVGWNTLKLEDVAKYVLFLTTDRGIAMGANGSCINFSANWPVA